MKNQSRKEWNEGELVTAFDPEDTFIKADKQVQDLLIASLQWQVACDKNSMTAIQYNELIETINKFKTIQAEQRETK